MLVANELDTPIKNTQIYQQKQCENRFYQKFNAINA